MICTGVRNGRRWCTAAMVLVATACTSGANDGDTEQVADSVFVPHVTVPAYAANGPRVLFDEAHNNYHTMSRRYKPFVDLLTLDGYRLTPNKVEFSLDGLRNFQVLVIVNAAGGQTEDDPDSILGLPAFEPREIRAVRDWVADGGALLLVADHYPSGSAANALASAFGVNMRNSWTFDSAHAEPGYGPYNITFSRENGLLGDHPITAGRDERERVNKVVAFTGQSLSVPPQSTVLLRLSDSAVDEDVTETVYVTAAGRAQGLALRFGRGRVVLLGEAAMLTAQQRVREGEVRRYGISYRESDNQQFALNTMHWLSGLLDGL